MQEYDSGLTPLWKVSVFVSVVLAAVPVVVVIGLLLTRLPAWVPPVAGVATAIAIGLGVLDAHLEELADTVGDSLVTMLKVLAIIGGGVTQRGPWIVPGRKNSWLTGWLPGAPHWARPC